MCAYIYRSQVREGSPPSRKKKKKMKLKGAGVVKSVTLPENQGLILRGSRPGVTTIHGVQQSLLASTGTLHMG